MAVLEVSKQTRALLDEVHDWAVNDVRPHGRESDEICAFPAAMDAVIAKSPVGNCPLDFFYTGPGLRRTDDPKVASALEGGKSVLGLLVMEEMCYGDGWGWQALPGNNLGERAVRLLGTEAQIEKWADGIARGEYRFTSICMTEEHCGSDLSQIKTTAVRDGDSWILRGGKRFISHGSTSDYLVVFAQTDPGSGLAGIRAFIVDRQDPGLQVTRFTEDKMGMRWYPQATLVFDDIVLDDDRRLPNANFGQVMSIMNGTRPFCAAWGVGTARGALDYAWSWLNEHDKGFNTKRWRRLEEDVASMRAALDRVRRLVLRAGARHDQGQADPTFAAMAKGYAAPINQAVTLRALQMMGPEGFSRDHLVEKWYRDAKFLDIVEGTGQLHRIAIARSEIGKSAAAA